MTVRSSMGIWLTCLALAASACSGAGGSADPGTDPGTDAETLTDPGEAPGDTAALDVAPDVAPDLLADLAPDLAPEAIDETVATDAGDEAEAAAPDADAGDEAADAPDGGADDGTPADPGPPPQDAFTDVPWPEPPVPAFASTGYYRVEKVGERWWMVDPDGKAFYSVGVNAIAVGGSVDRTSGGNPYAEAVAANYADAAAWATTTSGRLLAWGFNTVGAWSSDQLLSTLPYTAILYITGSDWLQGNIPDYFAPEFEARCAQVAADSVAPRATERRLIGWYLDNELRWGPDWRSDKTLLQDYLSLPAGAPGRVVAEQYAGDPQGFLARVASRYFEVTTKAIRAADPNHLILGIRAMSVLTPAEVAVAAAPWVDVFSVNWYLYIDGVEELVQQLYGPVLTPGPGLKNFFDATGRPILVTEFSFRAADTECPNTFPPQYPVLADQAERAAWYEGFVRSLYESPWIVGHHWFQYFDEPVGGRFDGEDSNFGLVDGHDQPYESFLATVTSVNAHAPHRGPPAP